MGKFRDVKIREASARPREFGFRSAVPEFTRLPGGAGPGGLPVRRSKRNTYITMLYIYIYIYIQENMSNLLIGMWILRGNPLMKFDHVGLNFASYALG